MDPGSIVVALVGLDLAVLGVVIYLYAGEMEPAPFEGTLYEHTSRRAREEAYRAIGLVLILAGILSSGASIVYGPMAGLSFIVAGLAVISIIHLAYLPRKAEEYLIEEPPLEGRGERVRVIKPPSLALRLASGIISLLQAPVLWKELYNLLSPDWAQALVTFLLVEAPVVILSCYTVCLPEAYAVPRLSVRGFRYSVLASPIASSLIPLGVYALIATESPLLAVALIVAGILLPLIPRLAGR